MFGGKKENSVKREREREGDRKTRGEFISDSNHNIANSWGGLRAVFYGLQ